MDQAKSEELQKKPRGHKKGKRKVFRTRKQKRQDRENPQSDDRDTRPHRGTPYKDIVKENLSFEKYYQLQKIVDSDSEWAEFMDTLRQPLPSSFRISSYCSGQAEKLRDLIRNEFIKRAEDSVEDGRVAIAPIPWYPNQLAWTINLSKVEIRKSPALVKLHEFLISETETGDISRQEAVSMIPPLLLDVKPGHSVLDMCAAPGSKTAQIIEMLHQESNVNFLVDGNSSSGTEKPLGGLVVANDVDNRRCYMLVHQSKRLHSPCVVITNHDASNMPNFYRTEAEGKRVPLKFDRVLADVPCSGDGTLRKNYDVWPKWNVANSNNFHFLQLKIARRGAELLARDGLLAYSTCSLNPMEDEAVVASLLNQAQGGLELVDAAKTIPELKCHPGLETWTVMSREEEIYADSSQVPEQLQSQIRDTLFPPDNAKELNLRYCVRVLPHYQNTGGFFIAILRKTVDRLPWEPDTPAELEKVPDVKPPEKNGGGRRGGRRRIQGHREDPFFFLNDNDEDWISLKSYYQLPDGISPRQLAHRCVTGKRRNIYYLSEQASNLIQHNPHVKLITGGARIFNRLDVVNVTCVYRLTQEGIPSLFPHFAVDLDRYRPPESSDTNKTFNIVQLDLTHLVRLLKYDDMKLEDFDPETRALVDRLPHGSCAFYTRLNRTDGSHFLLPICGWRGKTSVRAYVARADRSHLLRLCGQPPLDLNRKNKGEKRSSETEASDEMDKRTKVDQQ